MIADTLLGAAVRLLMLPLELAYAARAQLRERRRVRALARLVDDFRESGGI